MGERSGVRSELRCEAVSAEWQVEWLRLEERLSAPYEATLGLACADADARPSELLGQRVTFTLEREDFVRLVHGIAIEVRGGDERAGERARCELVVAPALRLAEHTVDSRIFQNASAPAIVEELLAPLLARDERTLRVSLTETYAEREHTTQYEESALAFVHRLLEDEGIAYSFEADEEAEVLVLTDANRSFAELVSTDGAMLDYRPVEPGAELPDAEHVSWIAERARLGPTSAVLSDWDWTSPANPPAAEARGGDPAGREHEHHVHRSAGTIGAYDAGARRYQERDHAQRATRWQEGACAPQRVVTGRSTVCGLGAGVRATLSGHPSLDAEYLVTEVAHELVLGERAGTGGTYSNTFEALPVEVPFRPARVTAKPRVEPETATVVGRGERGELHLDEHHRVKLQFHWDRRGQRNEHSSAWVRVAQAWAGTDGWGAHFAPRIGDEVVVTYVRGDPDRPIVTGHLFNADHPSPVATPERQTVSGFVTRSLGQAEGHNALLFDDDPGNEGIDLHAQRDLREVVRHDHTTRVIRDQSNTVGGDQIETVRGDARLTVEGERTHTVEGNETVTVRLDRETTVRKNDGTSVRASQRLEVDGDRRVTVKGTSETKIGGAVTARFLATHEREVSEHETVRVGGDRELIVRGTLTIRVGEGCTLTLTPDGHVTLEASSEIAARVGEHTRLRLVADELAAAAQTIGLVAESAATLSAAEHNALRLGEGKAELGGQREVSLQAQGGGNVTADAGGVTCSGQTISSQGTTSVEAASPLVKLN
ncbi:MAG: type VI secretion system tip protein VgrG [Sandaracinaceae bacterium]|nr:type VI secretion system tip protein VgrG [Sandaracinaceae bacterium]